VGAGEQRIYAFVRASGPYAGARDAGSVRRADHGGHRQAAVADHRTLWWRITHFLRHAREKIGDNPVFGKLRKAVETIDKQLERILERWTSTYSNARTKALNGIFKAARARARGYRNVATFITMIYLIAAPMGNLFNSI
jgi:hypothetical protein